MGLQFCYNSLQSNPRWVMGDRYSQLPASEVEPLGFVCAAAPLRVPLHKRTFGVPHPAANRYMKKGEEKQILSLLNLV
jgi:hypothetical protein